MTKQLNLDLAAALEDAQQGRDDGEMLIVRAGSAYMKVKAFNAGKHAAALRKIRAPRQRGELRTYPRFKLGMSTAEYVAKFAALNTTDEAIKNNRMPAYVLPFGNLNTAPCALYENGAFDFDVIEEIDADDAQSVAAPEVQAPHVAASPEAQSPGVAASPEFSTLMAQAREARNLAREAIARAKASSAQAVCISSTPKATQPTQAQPAPAVRFMTHYVTDGKNKAKVRYYASQDRSGRAFVDVDAKHHGAQLGRMLPGVRNDTDTMTDYFCKDSVRIYGDSPLYPAALARVNANEAARDARRAKRSTA